MIYFYINLFLDDWLKFNREDKGDKKALNWNIDNFIKGCTEANSNIKVI